MDGLRIVRTPEEIIRFLNHLKEARSGKPVVETKFLPVGDVIDSNIEILSWLFGLPEGERTKDLIFAYDEVEKELLAKKRNVN